jgi:hypothetical protein
MYQQLRAGLPHRETGPELFLTTAGEHVVYAPRG